MNPPLTWRISFFGDVPKWLREGFAKPSFTGSNPVVASGAGVAKQVDARDLKSLGRIDHAGSSPAPGTLFSHPKFLIIMGFNALDMRLSAENEK